jgi:hypothetical protein
MISFRFRVHNPQYCGLVSSGKVYSSIPAILQNPIDILIEKAGVEGSVPVVKRPQGTDSAPGAWVEKSWHKANDFAADDTGLCHPATAGEEGGMVRISCGRKPKDIGKGHFFVVEN